MHKCIFRSTVDNNVLIYSLTFNILQNLKDASVSKKKTFLQKLLYYELKIINTSIMNTGC